MPSSSLQDGPACCVIARHPAPNMGESPPDGIPRATRYGNGIRVGFCTL